MKFILKDVVHEVDRPFLKKNGREILKNYTTEGETNYYHPVKPLVITPSLYEHSNLIGWPWLLNPIYCLSLIPMIEANTKAECYWSNTRNIPTPHPTPTPTPTYSYYKSFSMNMPGSISSSFQNVFYFFKGFFDFFMLSTQTASLWGQYGAHLGPTGPWWAPCWPHEPCYLITFPTAWRR